jgi:hypothetical protein
MIDKNTKAFPVIQDNMYIEGLTIRQYYAAKAMQGMLATNDPEIAQIEKIVQACFIYADAMIDYENKQENKQ